MAATFVPIRIVIVGETGNGFYRAIPDAPDATVWAEETVVRRTPTCGVIDVSKRETKGEKARRRDWHDFLRNLRH